MEQCSRRSFLAVNSVIGIGVLSGCTTLQGDPPAGSVIVQNRHSLPHIVEIDLVDGPQSAVEVKDGVEAAVPIEPNSEKVYKGLLSLKGRYRIRAHSEDGQTVTFSVNPRTMSNGGLTVLRIDSDGA